MVSKSSDRVKREPRNRIMSYVTRKFLEQIFGNDPLKFPSPVVGWRQSKVSRRIIYSVNVRGFTPRQITSAFWKLRQKRIVEYKEDDDKIRVVLTEAGRKKVLSYQFDDMTITKPRRWDGKWRVVAFDIPESRKKARDALVQKMKDLGLVQFQKSLWLCPYECRNEIDFVAEVFEVGKYVHYLVAAEMTNDSLLRQRFGL